MTGSREKSLFKNTIIITIGKVSTQLITFLLLPLYTRILSTSEYGVVDLLNTLILLLLPIVTLQMEQALFRELIEVRNNNKEKKEVISSGIFTVIVQILLFLAIFFIVSPFVHNIYKWFLVINVIAYIFSSIFLQIARGLGDNVRYSVGSFISALSTIIFNILFLVIIKWGAYGMLLGTMLGQFSCAIYLFFFLRLYKYIDLKSIRRDISKKMIKYSIPLVPNAVSWWVFNTSDRVVVSTLLGLSANGILSVASKFSVIYVGLYNIFNMSWTESISVHIDDSDIENYFKNMFEVILNLFSAFMVLMISFMPIIYAIMVSGKFGSGYLLVPMLLIGSFFNIIVGLISVIYIAKKDTKSLASTSIFAAIINLITHLALIKFIGIYAAAVSTLIAYVILAAYRLSDIKKKYFAIRLDKVYILKTVIVLAIVLLLYYFKNYVTIIVSMLISLIYSYYINKKSFNSILNMIRGKFIRKKN